MLAMLLLQYDIPIAVGVLRRNWRLPARHCQPPINIFEGGVHNIGVAKYVVYVARGNWGRIGGGGRARTGMTEEGERTGVGG